MGTLEHSADSDMSDDAFSELVLSVQNAKSTADVLKDCQVVSTLAKTILKSAQSLNATETRFDPDVFAQGILARVRREEGRQDWSIIAREAKNVFRYAPGFTYIVGSNFKADPNVTTEPRTLKRVRQARKPLEATKEPEKVLNVERTDEGVAAVTQVFKVLMREYKRNGGQPICFFKFVVDPQSFSKTIENMFHLSFLVRDDKVAMSFDEDDLPVVHPTPEAVSSSGRHGGEKSAAKQQALISLSKEEWRGLIEDFEITEAILP